MLTYICTKWSVKTHNCLTSSQMKKNHLNGNKLWPLWQVSPRSCHRSGLAPGGRFPKLPSFEIKALTGSLDHLLLVKVPHPSIKVAHHPSTKTHAPSILPSLPWVTARPQQSAVNDNWLDIHWWLFCKILFTHRAIIETFWFCFCGLEKVSITWLHIDKHPCGSRIGRNTAVIPWRCAAGILFNGHIGFVLTGIGHTAFLLVTFVIGYLELSTRSLI